MKNYRLFLIGHRHDLFRQKSAIFVSLSPGPLAASIMSFLLDNRNRTQKWDESPC